MAGRIDCIERKPLDCQFLTVGQTHRDDVCLGLFAHYRDAMRVITQRAQPGDMIGMQVGVDCLHQFQVEFPDELKVAINLLQDRIDDQSLAARPAREQVGIGAGDLIEKLTKDHFDPTAAAASCVFVARLEDRHFWNPPKGRTLTRNNYANFRVDGSITLHTKVTTQT